jgi:hypothetical protein
MNLHKFKYIEGFFLNVLGLCFGVLILVFFEGGALADDPIDISLAPKGRVNESSTPELSWGCTPDASVAFNLIEDRTGNQIMDISWAPIRRVGSNRCGSSAQQHLAKKIIPPLKPFPPCKEKGCIRYATSAYGGLPPGDYTLTLRMKSSNEQISNFVSKFSIVENIYSNFSGDIPEWKPKNGIGNWSSSPGKYNVSGDTRGQAWISLFDGDVINNKKGAIFWDGRHFQIRMSPNCFSERCYAGLVLYNATLGRTNGIERDVRLEVVINGDQKLFIRAVSDESPNDYTVVLDGKNISQYIRNKLFYTIDVYVSLASRSGNIRVFIEDEPVFCGQNKVDFSGKSGVVFSSHEDIEGLEVEEFSVWPTPYLFHTCYWDLPYVPFNI